MLLLHQVCVDLGYVTDEASCENISYRRNQPGPNQATIREDSSRAVVELLRYKLALANLPDVYDVKGVAPKRDCGRCGARHVEGQNQTAMFTCVTCGHSEERHLNTAREVARRVLWLLAQKKYRGATPRRRYAQ